MEIEIGLTLLLLVVLSLLATADMAFGQLSDVALRRFTAEAEEQPDLRSKVFLKQVLDNRARFGFALSATIQILLVVVAVLITSISLRLFSDPRFVLVGLVGRPIPHRDFPSAGSSLYFCSQSRGNSPLSSQFHSTFLPRDGFSGGSISETI